MKILAVDDDPFILELLPLLAAKAGFKDVTTAASGHRALELLAEDEARFNCLILDINMPEMDGIELCAQIRKIEAYRQTPIIMLTAMSDRSFMDNAFRAGATDYAAKPFDINDLGARLRVARELVQARAEASTANASRAASEAVHRRDVTPDIQDQVDLDDVKSLLSIDALTNYLKQSSRAGLGALQLLAVKIDAIDSLHQRSNRQEFSYALREVADAIDAALLTKECLMAYAGNGIFLVVAGSPSPLIGMEVETDIQSLLDERNAEFDNGAPMDLEVSVGNPIQPHLSDCGDVPVSVERAIARAEARVVAKQDAPRGQFFRQIRQ